MSETLFDYTQRFQRRVILDSPLDRFVWDKFNFGTSYNEPFGQINLKNTSSQPYVYAQSTKPIRIIELEFSTMIYTGGEPNNCPKNINFNALMAFYVKHGCHSSFLFDHPVYGDMVVRFSKPIIMPKKNPGGSGTTQSFSITLVEVINTSFIFQKGENFNGKMPLYCDYFDVEMEYIEDSLAAPLGNNYYMLFKKTKPPMRTLTLSIQGMSYFINAEDDSINITHCSERNMALLEIFYLKHRLTEVFNFEYAGELIPVRFKEPLVISKVASSTGILETIQITLVESPFKTLTEGDIK